MGSQLHFVLFPLMAQGHMIPLIDIARLLAQHNSFVTILTTPLNAARFKPILDRATKSGLKIRLFQLQFPSGKPGLPQGCENVDMLPSLDKSHIFLTAACELEQQAFQLFQELNPRPSCIISDMLLPWTINIAKKWAIPRISFIGFSCFCMLCIHNVMVSNVLETITSETECFTVPGLPDTDSIQLTKLQLPLPPPNNQDMEEFNNSMKEAEEKSYGLIINTFEELESAYIKEYKKAKGNKRVWCIGPVSLCNKDMLDKAERGNRTSYNEQECIKWLDSWEKQTVIYVCLGSISNLMTPQMVELGLGLEESNRPFIWVLRGGEKSKEIEKWISESGFEERIKERGMVIKGWAPQVLILSHPAIGGFLTHCGWNSTLEGISAGLPMVTWPLFADQFCNEKVVVQVIKIGVSVVGAQKLGEEEQLEVLVKKEDIVKGINMLMEGGEEKEGRRRRAKQLGEMANRATQEGGSSYIDIQLLIQDIMHQIHQPN
ncbi:UDP-glycosyltransferase 73C25-like [Euphorbia lathyris]|uniref:UDP-glycosyltransferase 73C25-like n=1 Tax=Euphorbia lathyris TaxID=212925 RepID=UPI003313E24E